MITYSALRDKNRQQSHPVASHPRAKQKHRLSAVFLLGDSAGIRTPDPLLKRQLLCLLSYRIVYPRIASSGYVCFWLGRLDSNQRVRESKSLALPLGDAPMERTKGIGASPIPSFLSGVGDGTRTHNARNHNPVLCQLNYTHHMSNVDITNELQKKWYARRDSNPWPTA